MANPVHALLRCFDRRPLQWLLRYIVLGFAICVAVAIGFGSYSGRHSPPKYGDFEAQRHWMEITQHLSPSQWYFYDLDWWGLDYPPLTAYHSYILGKIGSYLNPKWFELDASRGYESAALKAFMRQTVLGSQAIFYWPAILHFSVHAREYYQLPVLDWATQLAAVLLQPSLLLIDNGHFQYNSVMLGLFVGSLAALNNNRLVVAAFLFTCSIMFKQMALYYALTIFFAILGKTTSLNHLKIKHKFKLFMVACTVIGVIAASMWPFHTYDQFFQVIHRMFPFSRGLWEDKVANFWCAANIFIKFKRSFTQHQLEKMALVATLLAASPACVQAYRNPKKRVLTWCFASGAWAFYLFSFQVHEKSVLLPLMPTTLLLFENKKTTRAMVLWINNIAYYSMLPLLKRDGLTFQYVVMFILWNFLFATWKAWPKNKFHGLVILCSYAAVAGLLIAEHLKLFPQLSRFPDLWVVLNVVLSFGCFFYFWLWQTRTMFHR